MRLGLERISALLEELEQSAGATRRDPRRGHERQVVDRALRRGGADGVRPAHGRIPLAARRRLGRARADRRPARSAPPRSRSPSIACRRRRAPSRRSLGEGPTQFEALTAAAFLVLAEGGVEACVVEAGLGGRHDATRVDQRPRRRAHERRPRPPARARRHARADPGREARRARAAAPRSASASWTTRSTRRPPQLAEAGGRDAASASPPGRGTACRCPPPTCATTPRSRCASPSCCSRRARSTASAAEAALAASRAARPPRVDRRDACDPARRRAQRRGRGGAGAGARRRAGRAPPARRAWWRCRTTSRSRRCSGRSRRPWMRSWPRPAGTRVTPAPCRRRRSPTRRARPASPTSTAEPEPVSALSRVRESARAREARSSSPDRSTCSSVCVPAALEAR